MYKQCIINTLLIHYLECPGPKDSCLLWEAFTDSSSDEDEGVGPSDQGDANQTMVVDMCCGDKEQ